MDILHNGDDGGDVPILHDVPTLHDDVPILRDFRKSEGQPRVLGSLQLNLE